MKNAAWAQKLNKWAFQQTFLCLKEGEREEIHEQEIQKQPLRCHWWLFSQLLSCDDEDPKKIRCSNNWQQFYDSFWRHSAKLSISGVLAAIKLCSHLFSGYLMTLEKITVAYMKVIEHSLCLRHLNSTRGDEALDSINNSSKLLYQHQLNQLSTPLFSVISEWKSSVKCALHTSSNRGMVEWLFS